MSDLQALERQRRELERVIEVRKARLKTRAQTLKRELQERFSPKGIASRFPLATLGLALGAGWLLGRAVGASLSARPSNDAPQPQPAASSPLASLLWEPLKELAVQTLLNFALNKTRDFLVNRSTRVQAKARAGASDSANVAP